MGNKCGRRRGKPINPGSALDRVISQASSDDCVLYRLADYKKGGRLLEEYLRGGGREVERLILEEFGIFMYNHGKGMQITRTEYLKWKYRHIPKDQMVVHMDTKSPYDPLKKWQDHEACWQMTFRGSLGESLLHVLIMCDTKAHTRIAKILLKCFPKLSLDVVEGEEYLGASALHLAIAYNNNDLVNLLVNCGANINQRAIGSFFLPKDQQVTNPPGPEYSDYEGLAYLGEYPLAWAACLDNETVYNRLLDHGASPNLQDNFGNMILHMVVICNQLGMFGYALRHPRLPAQDGIVNAGNLTPLTLACKLARSTIFREMLELTCIEFWRYSNITCSAYPLNALDTIKPNGETNWNSALMIILNGTKSEHLDMLEGGIIQRLLEEKWKTFAQNQFLKRLIIMLIQLITISVAIYLRPCYCGPKGMHLEDPLIMAQLHAEFFDTDVQSIIRYCFEVIVLLQSFIYLFVQQLEEVINQGLTSFMKGLLASPPKAVFVVANFLVLMCVPCRLSYYFSVNMDLKARVIEDELLAYGAAGSWFMMLFFAGALKLTGPFVVMIYKMILGDMFTFSIIYGIMLLGFTQAFYFLYKRTPLPDNSSKFATYGTTWMALFQMTLGDYDYSGMSQNIYSAMTKFVFLVFTIMLPIMLLNMLIAMMGNTYSIVISMSEKEWVKAWAKIVIALERAVSQEKLKDYLYTYSVPLGGGPDGEENLGVMVIKSAAKTKAKQRKGALSNWKRVGRVTIDALKRRGVSGEYLRREMWGLQSACSTPAHGPKKKGGVGAYNVKAGVTTENLEAQLWESANDEGPGFFNEDDHDGVGALTGALDQLTFTHDLDFSGDGVDDDPLKPQSRRPELFSAEAANKKIETNRVKEIEKRRLEADNPAFIDDEELLLASGITPDQDEDSDENIEEPRSKRARVVVQNNSYLDPIVKPVEPKMGKPPPPLPPLVDPKPRPSSVKLRRLGSARRKQTPKYGMAFSEPSKTTITPRASTTLPAIASDPIPNGNVKAHTDKSELQNKQGKKKKKEKLRKEKSLLQNETNEEDQNKVAKERSIEKSENTASKQNEKDTNKETEEHKLEKKESINQSSELPKESSEDHSDEKKEKTGNLDNSTPKNEDNQAKADLSSQKSSSRDDEDLKWAEKKSRKKNKVGPSTSKEETPKKEKLVPQDDSSLGLHSRTDNTRDEVKEKEKLERPKTCVAAKKKIKDLSSETVEDMNTILPWNNEEGDIAQAKP